jgi:hypothetical protein
MRHPANRRSTRADQSSDDIVKVFTDSVQSAGLTSVGNLMGRVAECCLPPPTVSDARHGPTSGGALVPTGEGR